MVWANRQKALNDAVFRAIEMTMAEWDLEFGEVLEVLSAARHAIEVQMRTSDKPKPRKPRDE